MRESPRSTGTLRNAGNHLGARADRGRWTISALHLRRGTTPTPDPSTERPLRLDLESLAVSLPVLLQAVRRNLGTPKRHPGKSLAYPHPLQATTDGRGATRHFRSPGQAGLSNPYPSEQDTATRANRL